MTRRCCLCGCVALVVLELGAVGVETRRSGLLLFVGGRSWVVRRVRRLGEGEQGIVAAPEVGVSGSDVGVRGSRMERRRAFRERRGFVVIVG